MTHWQVPRVKIWYLCGSVLSTTPISPLQAHHLSSGQLRTLPKWFFFVCLCSAVFISCDFSSHSLRYNHIGLLSVPWTHQVRLCLRTFALSILSAWVAFYPNIFMTASRRTLSRHYLFSGVFFWTTYIAYSPPIFINLFVSLMFLPIVPWHRIYLFCTLSLESSFHFER